MRPECGPALQTSSLQAQHCWKWAIIYLISYLKRAFLFARRLWAPQQEDIAKAICIGLGIGLPNKKT
ncbi:hypothetical protein NC652_001041 [Populus alba x Populus x berolinensis]|nr:hypothetical protein NC652_001041 [Populus alba x Populus x berolinensis]